MSGSIGGALGRGVELMPSDVSHGDEAYFGNDEVFQPDPLLASFSRARNDPADALGSKSWRTPWWPANGGFAGDVGLDISMLDRAPWWGDPWLLSGCNGRLAFVGVTRDQYGSPLGGCTVRCFRTSTNELVSTVLSDSNGNYQATSPYADAHFLTVHKSTAPDVAGATIDTLVPG